MQDMSAEQFLLGLRRFVARHGGPREIISDNAAQFKLAETKQDKIWGQILTQPDEASIQILEGVEKRLFTEFERKNSE